MAERFLLKYQGLRQAGWFEDYSDWFTRQELPAWMQNGYAGIFIILLPPLLAVSLVQHLLDDALLGIPGALFSCLALLYCLGPKDLEQEVGQFTQAMQQDDRERADSIAKKLSNSDLPAGENTYYQSVTESVLEQANTRIFAVIFWFILLGPLGAVLYRLVNYLPKLQIADKELDFFLNTKQLIAILDWAPARLTALSYAIAGSFEDAYYGWRSYHETRFDEFSNNASGILICTGSGALRLPILHGEYTENTMTAHFDVEAAMGLVWRSLFVWLILLLIFTLAGWI